MPDATTASDWLLSLEFGLANDSCCLKRTVRVSGAGGRFTLKLDARQSSSRRQPPALNVDRPTAAFEASELSLSTPSGPSRSPKADAQTWLNTPSNQRAHETMHGTLLPRASVLTGQLQSQTESLFSSRLFLYFRFTMCSAK